MNHLNPRRSATRAVGLALGLAFVLSLGSGVAAGDTVIYTDNAKGSGDFVPFENDGTPNRPNGDHLGNQVTFAGTERYLDHVQVVFASIGPKEVDTYTLDLYKNDGPVDPNSGLNQPGTLIAEYKVQASNVPLPGNGGYGVDWYFSPLLVPDSLTAIVSSSYSTTTPGQYMGPFDCLTSPLTGSALNTIWYGDGTPGNWTANNTWAIADGGATNDFDMTFTALQSVPEPSSMVLMALGAGGGLIAMFRRSRGCACLGSGVRAMETVSEDLRRVLSEHRSRIGRRRGAHRAPYAASRPCVSRRVSVEEEYGDGAVGQQVAGDGSEEELAEDGPAVGPHDEQAGAEAFGLLEDDDGRRRGGLDRMRRRLDVVQLEEMAGALGPPGGLGRVGVDADDVDRTRPAQAGRLERRQGALGLEAAVIRNDDRAGRSRRLGHDDDRTRRVLQDPFEQPVVRLVLAGGEVEVRPRRQQDQVAGTRLARDHLIRRAEPRDLLMGHPRPTAARGEVRQQTRGSLPVLVHAVLVPHVVHRVDAGLAADRPERLDRTDPRLVDDRQTLERGARLPRPADAQLGEGPDVLGRVEADQDAADHDGHPFHNRPSTQRKRPGRVRLHGGAPMTGAERPVASRPAFGSPPG